MKCPLHRLTMQPFQEDGRTVGIRCPEEGCGKGAYLGDPGYIPAAGYGPVVPFRPLAAVDPAPEPTAPDDDDPTVDAARRELWRLKRQATMATGPAITCRCGCGVSFVPAAGNQKYFTKTCRDTAHAARLEAQRKTSRRSLGSPEFHPSNQ